MILEHISTKQDIDLLLSELRKFKLDLFQYSSEDLLLKLKFDYSALFSDLVTEYLNKNETELSETTKLEVDKHLGNLESALNSIDTLELTIAFNPSQRFIDRINSWVYENVSPETVLDLKVDPDVIAGALVIYKGKYKDMTARTKFDKYHFSV